MYDVIIINRENNKENIEKLKNKFPFAKIINCMDTQLQTISAAVEQTKTKYVWILTDFCDYTDFNFEIRQTSDQLDQIYAWPTAESDYHDTFLIPKMKFLEQSSRLEKIVDYQFVRWFPDPIIKLPRKKLDVIYLSNGEKDELENYSWLEKVLGYKPIWVKGINNRTAAIKKAAELSTTPWFYLVPAKLCIEKNFNFNWYPDCLENTNWDNYYFYEFTSEYFTHYVFYAYNPVNELVYGHMAVVLYYKKFVLSTESPGLDFTLASPVTVIPELSGTATFNSTPLSTWRTAFREVIKLKYYSELLFESDAKERLESWLTKANGPNAEWSIIGANDAVDFFDNCNGKFKEIEKSYSWDWLNEFQKQKGYNL